MKKIIFFFFIVFNFTHCNKECLADYGNWIEQEFEVEPFSNITVYSGIELHIIDGSSQKVIVKTGENRLDQLTFKIYGETLEITTEEECIYNANYEPIKVYITHPSLFNLRNAGSYPIFSENTLTYPQLTLISENFQNLAYSNIGDFQVSVDNDRLNVISNGVSNFFIQGKTHTLSLGYYSGSGKFEGQNLMAQHVEVFHRGENTLKIFPVQSLIGNIYSVGNLLSFNHPDTVNITQHYTGKLIFN